MIAPSEPAESSALQDPEALLLRSRAVKAFFTLLTMLVLILLYSHPHMKTMRSKVMFAPGTECCPPVQNVFSPSMRIHYTLGTCGSAVIFWILKQAFGTWKNLRPLVFDLVKERLQNVMLSSTDAANQTLIDMRSMQTTITTFESKYVAPET